MGCANFPYYYIKNKGNTHFYTIRIFNTAFTQVWYQNFHWIFTIIIELNSVSEQKG